MKNNTGTIIKKELTRFFGDKRLFFTTVLMPGLMIFLVYTLMGNFMADRMTTSDDYVFQIVTKNMPQSLDNMFEGDPMDLTAATETDDIYMDQIRNKEIDLYMVFPEDFDEAVASYDIASGMPAPEIQMYYISTESNSATIYRSMAAFFESYEATMINKFDINTSNQQYDLASDEDLAGMIVSMILPMLLMVFLFSGCVAVAPESIAGEKERGTIATLLVTPMKRSELALGKIISLTIMSLLSALSSFLGTMLSLPKMIAMSGELDTSVYKATDYIILLPILLATVLVIITIVALISANAKSVKEATSSVAPLQIVVMVIAITSMLGSGAATNHALYLIPLYNSAQCMTAIFSFSTDMVNVAITVVSNLVYAILMGVGLTKMFESEKVMFS